MSQTSPRLLAGLFTTSAIVSLALTWSGWRLFEQQRDLDARLAHDRTEAAATAMAASIREKLADLSDFRLSHRPCSRKVKRQSSLRTPSIGLSRTIRPSRVMLIQPSAPER